MAETQAERPVTYEPSNEIAFKALQGLHGRQKITLPMSKEQFEDGDVVAKIMQYLPYVLRVHNYNKGQIDYLYNYYKGIQPILAKEKVVRPDINHIVLENHAYEFVNFKKSYIFGKPIQYVYKGSKDSEAIEDEIATLNTFMENISKTSEDGELAEWQYICGTGYRYIDKGSAEDNSPFIMSSPDPRSTFVVYSNSIKEEVLFSGFVTYKSNLFGAIPASSASLTSNLSFDKTITIYTDDFYLVLESYTDTGIERYRVIPQSIQIGGATENVEKYPLVIKGNRIIEYPLNNARLGLIEVVMSLLDAINQVKSNDIDDIDQFVQSLLVFINQEVEPEKFKQLIALGAIEVNSADASRPADVKLLTSQLSHSETKIVTMDLYQTALRICGIPINAGSSSGDTGNAKSIGEGWTMADARANQDEQNFKKHEKKALKLIIDICKQNHIEVENQVGDKKLKQIEKLSPLDIDIKFTRNKSDNLLVKTQGLLNMMSCQIEPQIAFETSGLFSDPNEVFVRSSEYFDGNLWKASTEANSNLNGDKPKVMNNMKDTTDVDSIDVNNLPFDKKVRENVNKKEDKE